MAKNKDKGHRLWDGITEDDFINENNIEEIDVADYDMEHMTAFSANINYFRQIIRLSDSLKPVERRILYTMYTSNLKPTAKTKKSQGIIGDVSKLHAHLEVYKTLVGMAQPWKKSCPLIKGKGNFGTDEYPEIFAAMRYTEATISKYAWECFFEDYDSDCVETIFNSASDGPEPMSLPSKFPNILVNGSMGIAIGNAFCVPSYNINDIIKNCQKVLDNPDCTDVFMIPDLPTGCDIIDDGHTFRDIVETGNGSLKMRSTIEIIEGKKNWILKVHNLPWLTSLTTIQAKLVELAKAGKLPIKDLQNESYPIKLPDGTYRKKIEYNIVIDKSHDPYQVLEKLYKMTDLQKPLGVNFNVVLEGLSVDRLSMKDLILAWLDERRFYKRRLYNKKLTRISARIDLLEILIYLLKSENIEKTVKIIKDSDSSEIVPRLMKHGNMNSHQATNIANMKLSAFTKDAKKKYKEEKAKLEVEKKELIELLSSEKKIDKVISEELSALKKYASPRKSHVIEESGRYIPDTDYNIVLTKQNYIKKIPVNEDPKKNNNMGSFRNLDLPINRIKINNLERIIFVDSFGCYTSMPVSDIDTTSLSHYGLKAYDVTKLNGNIMTMEVQMPESAIETLTQEYGTPYLVTLTANGFIKKTPLTDIYSLKNTKNVRVCKLRENDYLAACGVILDHVNIIIYTKNGHYGILNLDTISPQSKNGTGVTALKIDDDDECIGFSVIGSEDTHIVVLTEHGNIKKCELQYFGTTTRNKKDSSYLTALDKTDSVRYVASMNDSSYIAIVTRTDYHIIPYSDIPTLTRKAKCKKMISQNEGNIVWVSV